jgi:hypothetical protein
MDRAVVKNENDRLLWPAWAGSVKDIQPLQEIDEVAAALGGTGIDDQPAGGAIEDTEQRPLARLPRRWDPQICAPFGPGVGERGMREGLRCVAEQQPDITGFGVLLHQVQAQTGAVNRIGILPSRQRVARPTPGEAPFFSTTLSRDFEMRSPVRRSISSCRRGKVQFARSAISGVTTSSITDNAACVLVAARPGAVRAHNPATPLRPKIHRQCRTLSVRTPNAAAIRSPVQPATDNRMARARSASSRSDERAKARNSSRCSALAAIHDWLGISPSHTAVSLSGFCHVWTNHENPA